jgi:hypothetical protein
MAMSYVPTGSGPAARSGSRRSSRFPARPHADDALPRVRRRLRAPSGRSVPTRPELARLQVFTQALVVAAELALDSHAHERLEKLGSAAQLPFAQEFDPRPAVDRL